MPDPLSSLIVDGRYERAAIGGLSLHLDYYIDLSFSTLGYQMGQ